MVNAVVLLGAPGSGKSTIATLIADQLGWHYLSTGDIARQIAEEQDLDFLERGDLAPEHMIRDRVSLILQLLQSHFGGFVIDGMPRIPEQVDFLADLVKPLYVRLFVDEDIILNRLRARGRDDDTEEVIAQRIKIYNENIEAIVNRITEHGQKLINISYGHIGPHIIASRIVDTIRLFGGRLFNA